MSKLALFEGTSRPKSRLIMVGSRKDVTKRKRERATSKSRMKSIKFWLVEVSDKTPDSDIGKNQASWMWPKKEFYASH
jgi:hypothetical protein